MELGFLWFCDFGYLVFDGLIGLWCCFWCFLLWVVVLFELGLWDVVFDYAVLDWLVFDVVVRDTWWSVAFGCFGFLFGVLFCGTWFGWFMFVALDCCLLSCVRWFWGFSLLCFCVCLLLGGNLFVCWLQLIVLRLIVRFLRLF